MDSIKEDVQKIFKKISKAKSIKDLIDIEESFDAKYKIKVEKNPEISFKIIKSELDSIDSEIIKKGFSFDKIKLKTPLEKLFYAMAWKQGDLPKLKHIVQGISDSENDVYDENRNSGFVFYQFGRYLTKKIGEPIIDQHILRSFIVYKQINKDKEVINNYLKLESISKKHIKWIKEYKKWLVSLNKNFKEDNYTYYIDRVLFALGKSIKKK